MQENIAPSHPSNLRKLITPKRIIAKPKKCLSLRSENTPTPKSTRSISASNLWEKENVCPPQREEETPFSPGSNCSSKEAKRQNLNVTSLDSGVESHFPIYKDNENAEYGAKESQERITKQSPFTDKKINITESVIPEHVKQRTMAHTTGATKKYGRPKTNGERRPEIKQPSKIPIGKIRESAYTTVKKFFISDKKQTMHPSTGVIKKEAGRIVTTKTAEVRSKSNLKAPVNTLHPSRSLGGKRRRSKSVSEAMEPVNINRKINVREIFPASDQKRTINPSTGAIKKEVGRIATTKTARNRNKSNLEAPVNTLHPSRSLGGKRRRSKSVSEAIGPKAQEPVDMDREINGVKEILPASDQERTINPSTAATNKEAGRIVTTKTARNRNKSNLEAPVNTLHPSRSLGGKRRRSKSVSEAIGPKAQEPVDMDREINGVKEILPASDQERTINPSTGATNKEAGRIVTTKTAGNRSKSNLEAPINIVHPSKSLDSKKRRSKSVSEAVEPDMQQPVDINRKINVWEILPASDQKRTINPSTGATKKEAGRIVTTKTARNRSKSNLETPVNTLHPSRSLGGKKRRSKSVSEAIGPDVQEPVDMDREINGVKEILPASDQERTINPSTGATNKEAGRIVTTKTATNRIKSNLEAPVNIMHPSENLGSKKRRSKSVSEAVEPDMQQPVDINRKINVWEILPASDQKRTINPSTGATKKEAGRIVTTKTAGNRNKSNLEAPVNIMHPSKNLGSKRRRSKSTSEAVEPDMQQPVDINRKINVREILPASDQKRTINPSTGATNKEAGRIVTTKTGGNRSKSNLEAPVNVVHSSRSLGSKRRRSKSVSEAMEPVDINRKINVEEMLLTSDQRRAVQPSTVAMKKDISRTVMKSSNAKQREKTTLEKTFAPSSKNHLAPTAESSKSLCEKRREAISVSKPTERDVDQPTDGKRRMKAAKVKMFPTNNQEQTTHGLTGAIGKKFGWIATGSRAAYQSNEKTSQRNYLRPTIEGTKSLDNKALAMNSTTKLMNFNVDVDSKMKIRILQGKTLPKDNSKHIMDPSTGAIKQHTGQMAAVSSAAKCTDGGISNRNLKATAGKNLESTEKLGNKNTTGSGAVYQRNEKISQRNYFKPTIEATKSPDNKELAINSDPELMHFNVDPVDAKIKINITDEGNTLPEDDSKRILDPSTGTIKKHTGQMAAVSLAAKDTDGGISNRNLKASAGNNLESTEKLGNKNTTGSGAVYQSNEKTSQRNYFKPTIEATKSPDNEELATNPDPELMHFNLDPVDAKMKINITEGNTLPKDNSKHIMDPSTCTMEKHTGQLATVPSAVKGINEGKSNRNLKSSAGNNLKSTKKLGNKNAATNFAPQTHHLKSSNSLNLRRTSNFIKMQRFRKNVDIEVRDRETGVLEKYVGKSSAGNSERKRADGNPPGSSVESTAEEISMEPHQTKRMQNAEDSGKRAEINETGKITEILEKQLSTVNGANEIKERSFLEREELSEETIRTSEMKRTVKTIEILEKQLLAENGENLTEEMLLPDKKKLPEKCTTPVDENRLSTEILKNQLLAEKGENLTNETPLPRNAVLSDRSTNTTGINEAREIPEILEKLTIERSLPKNDELSQACITSRINKTEKTTEILQKRQLAKNGRNPTREATFPINEESLEKSNRSGIIKARERTEILDEELLPEKAQKSAEETLLSRNEESAEGNESQKTIESEKHRFNNALEISTEETLMPKNEEFSEESTTKYGLNNTEKKSQIELSSETGENLMISEKTTRTLGKQQVAGYAENSIKGTLLPKNEAVSKESNIKYGQNNTDKKSQIEHSSETGENSMISEETTRTLGKQQVAGYTENSIKETLLSKNEAVSKESNIKYGQNNTEKKSQIEHSSKTGENSMISEKTTRILGEKQVAEYTENSIKETLLPENEELPEETTSKSALNSTGKQSHTSKEEVLSETKEVSTTPEITKHSLKMFTHVNSELGNQVEKQNNTLSSSRLNSIEKNCVKVLETTMSTLETKVDDSQSETGNQTPTENLINWFYSTDLPTVIPNRKFRIPIHKETNCIQAEKEQANKNFRSIEKTAPKSMTSSTSGGDIQEKPEIEKRVDKRMEESVGNLQLPRNERGSTSTEISTFLKMRRRSLSATIQQEIALGDVLTPQDVPSIPLVSLRKVKSNRRRAQKLQASEVNQRSAVFEDAPLIDLGAHFYLEDFAIYQMEKEKMRQFSGAFPKEKTVTAEQRQILIGFLISVHAYYGYCSGILYQAVKIFDAILNCTHVALYKLQLTALASLWIAIKREQFRIPTATKMLSLAKDMYEGKTNLLSKCEWGILKTLNFYIHFPEPHSIVAHHLCFSDLNIEANRSETAFYCSSYLIDVCLLNENLAETPASLLAATVASISLFLVMEDKEGLENPKWSSWHIKSMRRIPLEEIDRIRPMILKDVLHSTKKRSCIRKVYKKYTDPRYYGVSKFIVEKVQKLPIWETSCRE